MPYSTVLRLDLVFSYKYSRNSHAVLIKYYNLAEDRTENIIFQKKQQIRYLIVHGQLLFARANKHRKWLKSLFFLSSVVLSISLALSICFNSSENRQTPPNPKNFLAVNKFNIIVYEVNISTIVISTPKHICVLKMKTV